jgi:hypothetical protein
VRWLDAALAVPFFLSASPTAIVQNAKLTQNESGVKPPHSKKGSKLLLGGSTQNKYGIKPIGLDKHKLNTPGRPPFSPRILCWFLRNIAARAGLM